MSGEGKETEAAMAASSADNVMLPEEEGIEGSRAQLRGGEQDMEQGEREDKSKKSGSDCDSTNGQHRVDIGGAALPSEGDLEDDLEKAKGAKKDDMDSEFKLDRTLWYRIGFIMILVVGIVALIVGLVYGLSDNSSSSNGPAAAENDMALYVKRLNELVTFDGSPSTQFVRLNRPEVNKDFYLGIYSYGRYEDHSFRHSLFNTTVHVVPAEATVYEDLTFQSPTYGYGFKDGKNTSIFGYGVSMQLVGPSEYPVADYEKWRQNYVDYFEKNERTSLVVNSMSLYAESVVDGFVSGRVHFQAGMCEAMASVPAKFRDSQYIYAMFMQFMVGVDLKVSYPLIQPVRLSCPSNLTYIG
eukprot:Nk52_evm64s266 gene=Nk52_evmTU64s266